MMESSSPSSQDINVEEESESEPENLPSSAPPLPSNSQTTKTTKIPKRGSNLDRHRKYKWKRDKNLMTSADDGGSSATDSSVNNSLLIEVTDDETRHDVFCCEKSPSEPHVCSETDGGFSEGATSDYHSGVQSTAEEALVDDKPAKNKRLRKKTRQRSVKVGNLRIDDGQGTPGSSDSDSDLDVTGLSDIELSEDDINNPSSPELASCKNADEPSNQSPNDFSSEAHTKAAGKDGTASTSQTSDDFLSDVTEKLKILLSEEWTVDTGEGQVLRVIYINKNKKAVVEKSLWYDRENKSVGIFVRGLPVPRENKIFSTRVIPDSDNFGSVADFISELVLRTQIFKVCDGIREMDEFWDISNGFLDYSESLDEPQYRDGNCCVLIEKKYNICFGCKMALQKIERQINKIVEQSGKSSRVADKYLSKEELIKKKNEYRKLAKHEKQRADRLQLQVNDLKIKLDAAMSHELSKILRENAHKMTDLQKTFWEAQAQALKLDDMRGMRWHPMLVRIALHLHSLSAGAYEFLNKIKVLCLPSERRLFDYSHFIEAAEGCQKEITIDIKNKIEKCGSEDHFKYVNLLLDEMHIRSGLLVKQSTGELVGFTKLDGIDEELRKMQHEVDSTAYKPKLAKKVLVYMVRGITSHSVKDVVAVYTTDDLSVNQLYDKSWEVIYHLEEFSIKVLAVTCDGAAVNRKFFQMHQHFNKEEASSQYVFCTKNLAGNSRPLFFICDPPHLLKAIRNALANSGSHRKTRSLWLNDQYLSWKVIEKLYALSKQLKFCGHKLTKAHIKLSSFSCMTVIYATQVLSQSVGRYIQELSSHEDMAGLDTTELVKFIFLMDKFFDCLNGMEVQEESTKMKSREELRTEINVEGSAANLGSAQNSKTVDSGESEKTDKAPYKDVDDSRFDFLLSNVLGYFEDWKKQVSSRPGIFTQTERNQMIISHQALGAVEITVKGVIGAIRFMLSEAEAPSVCSRVFNQDPLEQYFSKIRRSLGDNRNPGAEAVLHSRLRLHAAGNVSVPSEKGNTGGQKREIEVDHTPLLSRNKKVKKE